MPFFSTLFSSVLLSVKGSARVFALSSLVETVDNLSPASERPLDKSLVPTVSLERLSVKALLPSASFSVPLAN